MKFENYGTSAMPFNSAWKAGIFQTLAKKHEHPYIIGMFENLYCCGNDTIAGVRAYILLSGRTSWNNSHHHSESLHLL